MNKRVIFRYIGLIVLLVTFGFGCQAVNNISKPVQIVATNTSSASATPQASIQPGLSTELPIPDMSTMLPDIETMIPGDLFGPEGTLGPAPTDVPLMPGGEVTASDPNKLSFDTDSAVKDVANFYDQEMPKAGWTKVAAESSVTSSETKLVYTKGGRKATVVISEDMFMGTTVEITISGT